MLMNIVLGVVTCLLVVTGFHLFENGKVFDYTTDPDGTKRRKLSFLTKAGANGWIAGAISGAALAFINYFTEKITLSTIWLAWVFLVIVVVGYVLLAWWWKDQEGCEVSEGICFFLISMVPFLTMKTLVGIAAAPWKNVFLTRLFCTLPILLVLAELVFMIISAIQIRGGGQKLKWIVSAVALMLVVLFITAGLTGCGGPSVEAVENAYDQQNLSVQKLTPEDLEKLTLTKYKDIPTTLLDSSLSPKDKERTSKTGMSDALTFGFESKDTTKMFKELEAEILRNPVYGVAVANAIKDKKIGNQKINDLNPWMNEMTQKNQKGVFVWCEYRGNDTKVIYVTEEYRCYAATLCTFLERLVEQGVQSHQTIENWCLNSAAKNNDRAGIMAEYQYKKDAFVLAYIPKSEAGKKDAKGLFVIGLNVHDKRPEFFDKEDPPEVVNVPTPTDPDPDNPPTPTNPGSDTPTKPSGGSDPPKPTNPPESPTTPTTKQKDPADDPVNNGNAQKGGGDNKPSDGSGEYQAQDPRTEKQDPADVKPDTPAVVPEHKAEEQAGQIVDHENKMDYAPDPVTDRGPVNSQKPVTDSNGDGEFVPSN